MDFDNYLLKLDKLVEFMSAKGLQSLKASVDGTSVELVFSAKMPKRVASSVDAVPSRGVFDDHDGAGVCACGHSWVEHDVAGCYRGCSHDLCISDKTNIPEQQ